MSILEVIRKMKEKIQKLLEKKEKEFENAKYPEQRLYYGGYIRALKDVLKEMGK